MEYMEDQRTLARRSPAAQQATSATECSTASAGIGSRADCLEQLLLAFWDIADYDDIHQAAQRLDFVLQWIRDEAARAACDPIFVNPPSD